MSIWYATRESVKAALDVKLTARSDRQVDEAIASASRTIEGLTHRRFYPEVATRYFDWPNSQYARPWRLWLDSDELISASTLTVADVEIPSTDYFLRRSDGRDEPPYTHIEIDLDSPAAFTTGGTHQRAITIDGTWSGCPADEAAAGQLAAAPDSGSTTVMVSDSAAIGVGNLIRVGTERMLVTGKTMASTGQALQDPMTASNADVTVAVSTGSAFAVDEVILLDAERMLIVDIAGNNLIVRRAWDGSVLAAHTGSAIYAQRTLTVERGALGTSAAAHDDASAITRYEPPALVRELAIAEALNTLLQRSSGYARVIGSGDNQREAAGRALRDLRDQVYTAYGRKARSRAV